MIEKFYKYASNEEGRATQVWVWGETDLMVQLTLVEQHDNSDAPEVSAWSARLAIRAEATDDAIEVEVPLSYAQRSGQQLTPPAEPLEEARRKLRVRFERITAWLGGG